MKFGLRFLGFVVVLLGVLFVAKFMHARRQSQDSAVKGNLHVLARAAERCFQENDITAVSYAVLVGDGRYIKTVNSIAGETYDHLYFVNGEPLRVRLPRSGRVIEYPPLGSWPAESR